MLTRGLDVRSLPAHHVATCIHLEYKISLWINYYKYLNQPNLSVVATQAAPFVNYLEHPQTEDIKYQRTSKFSSEQCTAPLKITTWIKLAR